MLRCAAADFLSLLPMLMMPPLMPPFAFATYWLDVSLFMISLLSFFAASRRFRVSFTSISFVFRRFLFFSPWLMPADAACWLFDVDDITLSCHEARRCCYYATIDCYDTLII